MKPPEKKLRAWRFAGLLTTYSCNARCAFCYVWGAPELGQAMSPDDAVAYWRQLDRVAAIDGRSIEIHIAGGEPFGQWDNLLAILQAAADAGLPPAQKVETNANWATDDDLTRRRLTALHAAGLRRIDVSTDVYHQEFVPVDRVRRCVAIAREIFGPDGVRVRWEAFLNEPVIVSGMHPPDRDRAFVEAQSRIRERMTGRAAFQVAPLLAQHPIERFEGRHCLKELLKSKHIHVGPDGSVFPGVCGGILLGNARHEPLDEMWHRLADRWRDEPILAPLVHEGPLALAERASRAGYEPRPAGYASKCHLCTHVRQFLFERGEVPGHLGPSACYSPTPCFP
ncbi:MAG: radical SAM protein [Phycisphaerae bacterium]|nr:radical SAM protein [Phycisphaerae bacterium]